MMRQFFRKVISYNLPQKLGDVTLKDFFKSEFLDISPFKQTNQLISFSNIQIKWNDDFGIPSQ